LTLLLLTLVLMAPTKTISGGKKVSVEDIFKRLESVDFQVLKEIEALDARTAFELLEKGLAHSNEDVRELSVLALGKRRETQADKLLMKALVDDDLSVQTAAVDSISKRLSPEIVADLQIIIAEVDAEIQAEIVLLLGAGGGEEQRDFLRSMLPKAREKNEEELTSNIVLALARLGDEDSRHEIIKNLQSEDIVERVDAIESLEYVNDAKLAIYLKPLLDDTAVAMDIGKSPKNLYLRICDLAVLTIQKITGITFSFPVSGRQFSEEERREVGRHIAN